MTYTFDDTMTLSNEEKAFVLKALEQIDKNAPCVTFRGKTLKLNTFLKEFADANNVVFDDVVKDIFKETDGLSDIDAFKKLYSMQESEDELERDLHSGHFDGCLSSIVDLEIQKRLCEMLQEKEDAKEKGRQNYSKEYNHEYNP